MSKVDRADRSDLDEITQRAAARPSGIHVAADGIRVRTDAEVGAYCDQFGRELAAKRAAQQAAISGPTHERVAGVLDGDTARDK